MHRQLGVGLNVIFETHIKTTDLPRAMAFYGETLGLELAHHVPAREVTFYWIGAPGHAMLGVWRVPPEAWVPAHFAFAIREEQIDDALAGMRRAGIQLTDEPLVHPWMPACGIFFHDPDGNSLELLAMLASAPRPELLPMPLSAWRALPPAVDAAH